MIMSQDPRQKIYDDLQKNIGKLTGSMLKNGGAKTPTVSGPLATMQNNPGMGKSQTPIKFPGTY